MERYCKDCQKVTSHRQKGLRPTVNVCNECDCINSTYTLIKSNGETHRAEQTGFIEWQSEELGSRGKSMLTLPKIGTSLVLDPQFGFQYTWLTTTIEEIIEQQDDYLKFRTKNSEYELFGPIKKYDEAEGTAV